MGCDNCHGSSFPFGDEQGAVVAADDGNLGGLVVDEHQDVSGMARLLSPM
jgi:hypothetical protein